jgi:hypothetical protein
MLFKGATAIYPQNHMKTINTLSVGKMHIYIVLNKVVPTVTTAL